MKTIKVFHVSRVFLGDEAVLKPGIPEFTAERENEFTPRVPASLNVLSCLKSMELSFDETVYASSAPLPLWVYVADVPVEDIYQPTTEDVPDVWMTGELWVTKPIAWHLESKVFFMRHMSFLAEDLSSHEKSVYSGYSLTYEGEKEIPERVGRPVVYDDSNRAFSFIEVDPLTAKALGI